MDDTKKLIEKYKRELMELSAASQKRKPEQQTADPSTSAKKPKIIGYVDENNSAYDTFLAELGKTSDSETAAAPQAPAPKPTADVTESAPLNSDFNVEPNLPDNADKQSSSDKPKMERKPENASEQNSPAEPEMERKPENANEQSSLAEPEMNREPERASEQIAPVEPKPDSEPEQSSANEPEIVREPDGDITEIIDETDGKPLFTPPQGTEISSTEQVREQITENSDPADNRPTGSVSGVTDNSATAQRPNVADTLTTSAVQAERLNDQPVSGTDPNEQLTGRSFEGITTPPETDISMERGSRAEPIQYPETNYGSYNEFEKANLGRGSLIFRVYTGRQSVPIEGAECVITKKIAGQNHTITKLVTNSSGQTTVQELPTPPKELSQQSENTIQPFALYDATVTKPGFVNIVLKDIPVFDGVQSVQRVFMIVDS